MAAVNKAAYTNNLNILLFINSIWFCFDFEGILENCEKMANYIEILFKLLVK